MKIKRSVLSFLREILIVVIGILVALFINNWNEELRQERIIEKTLSAIGEEIRESRSELEPLVEKHTRTVDSLALSMDDESKTLLAVFTSLEGLQVPEIKNIGLRFFITSYADLVNYELISDLSEIEFLSRLLDQKVNRLTDLIYDHLHDTDRDSKFKVSILISDVLDTEKGLIEPYDKFLEKHTPLLQ